MYILGHTVVSELILINAHFNTIQGIFAHRGSKIPQSAVFRSREMPLKSHPQEGLSMTLFFPFHGNKASEPHTLVLSTSLSHSLPQQWQNGWPERSSYLHLSSATSDTTLSHTHTQMLKRKKLASTSEHLLLQDREATGHMAPTVRKQREGDTSAQLIYLHW